MKKNYIELKRSFRLIDSNKNFDEVGYDSLAFRFLESKKWDDLLKLRRVVILAEAGAGKTEEVRAITNKLRKEGSFAFFLRLEHLFYEFETSFVIGTAAEFSNWVDSKNTAWFFLDSVDESKLSSIDHFEFAIKKLGIKLDVNDCKQRAHIYITSRNSEWRAQYDFNYFKDKIPYFELSKVPEKDNEIEFDFDQSFSGQEQEREGDPKLSDPIVFELNPLNIKQVKIFTENYGVREIDSFITTIQKNEIEIYTRRPIDLIELIKYWNKNGKIDNHATMIEEIIGSKLSEQNSTHDSALQLTQTDARYGVEMLAASVTFVRKSRILIPDSPPDPSIKSESIDVKDVLQNWESLKIRALLQRPIFDNEIYGTVRFHHRSVIEYLTAKWLHSLILQGKSRIAIENLLFKELYDQQIIVPSIRKVLSWLVLFDDRIRNKTIKIAPEVFFEGGDPSFLSLEDRKQIIEKFCDYFAKNKFSHTSFSRYELSRFAHKDLAQTINSLLEKYQSDLELEHFLLRLAWQGEIQGCSEKALTYVLDRKQGIYKHIYGIRVVEVVGTTEQKEKIIRYFLSMRSKIDVRLIRELIDAFGAEKFFTLKNLFSLIKRIEPNKHKNLNSILENFSLTVCTFPELLDLIKGILSFLKKSPTTKRRNIEISNQYNWLLPCAALAAKRLIQAKNPNALDPNVLEILTMVQSNHIYYSYKINDHKLGELVPKWPELNRALFWQEVSISRLSLSKRRNKRLTELFQVESYERLWKLSIGDIDWVIDDISIQKNIDDRLLALSTALNIYTENGRKKVLRDKLKKVVIGNNELENKLQNFFTSPAESDENKKWRKERANYRYRQKKQKEYEQENRKKWIKWLKANNNILKDSSIASSGKVWQQTTNLIDELYEKGSDNRWAVSNWKKLIPEFSEKVAISFRDGCIDYWRKYKPKINSEEISKMKNTTYATIVGLSGLEMETDINPDWPNNLAKKEAELACRYAVNEMNGFPDWLEKLHSVFPTVVQKALLKEIEWEFSKYDSDDFCHYVLSDVVWNAEWIKSKIANGIIPILKKYEPRHDDTIQNAISIVLSSAHINKENLLAVISHKLKLDCSLYRKSLWYAAWLQIDAKNAIESMIIFLENIVSFEQAKNTAMHLIVALFGSRIAKLNSIYYDYKRPQHLCTLIKLMHKYIHSSDDINRANEGGYTPELRDDAQNARGQLFEILKEIPGEATYHAMLDLAHNHPDPDYREWYKVYAKRRAEKDAETVPWKPNDISQFAIEAERAPQNHRDLYELSISRLLNLRLMLEEGDYSNANILKEVKKETEHRKYIGGWLRENSVGRYNVPQEEELADGTKPDIRILGAGFDGPVPIELKVVDNNWSGRKLIERLNNQLCGQYLRDVRSNCGIFLLIYRGEKKSWQHPTTKESLNFEKLIELLEEEAKVIIRKRTKIESLKIIGIDLTKRKKFN